MEKNLSRRKFIRDVSLGTLGVTTARTFVGCEASPKKIKIAIVGAGLAGLRAAYLLAKEPSVEISLFEASDRTGGRIFTKHDLFSAGISTDLGGEFIDTGHNEMDDLIREFGLTKIDSHDNTEGFSRFDILFNNIVRTNNYDSEWSKYSKVIIDNKHKSSIDPKFTESLNNLSLSEYLKKYQINGWFAEFLRWIFTAEYGLNADELNCLYLHDMLNEKKQTLFENVTDQRYKIKGGSQTLTDELTKKLSGNIFYRHKLTHVVSNGENYSLHFDNQKMVEADYIILAIPLSIMREVSFSNINLSTAKKSMIANAHFGTNSKVLLGFAERIWRTNKSAGFLITDNLQSGWDSSQLQNGDGGAGVYTFFLGGVEGKSIVNEGFNPNIFLDRMELIYRGAKKAYSQQSFVYNWSENPFSKGSYLCLKPGQWLMYDFKEWQKPEGNIYFAGEHCSEKYQGFMNGAAESARVVVEKLIERLHTHK